LSPGHQDFLQQLEGVQDRPVGELGDVAQVAQVVDVAEELALQHRVRHHRNGTVLVQRFDVGLQPRGEVGEVVGDLLDHELPHLAVPDGLRRVVLP